MTQTQKPARPEANADDLDRFRKPAPVIELTPDVIAKLNELLEKAQQFASLNGLPWRTGANAGKPLLYGGEEGRGSLLAYGTIGSWSEFDLAVEAVNALPALLLAFAEQSGAGAPSVSRDAATTIAILRRALAWHGDASRMATTREEWQQEIDAAMLWVKENPEEGRPSFPTLAYAAAPCAAAVEREALMRALRQAAESVGDDSDYAATARNWIRNRDDLLADAILSLLQQGEGR